MLNLLRKLLKKKKEEAAEENENTFAPRLWRVNEDLARRLFGMECVCVDPNKVIFCGKSMSIPYETEEYLRWYTVEEKTSLPKYWEYIRYCDALRGKRATACRSQTSAYYIPPFPLKHYHIYELNSSNGS